MSVVVKIPTQLRSASGGEAETVLDGATVQEGLDGPFERFEELRARISDDDGSLRRFVNVYLAGEDIRFLDGLQTPVSDGAELTILPAVAGGSGRSGGPGVSRRRRRWCGRSARAAHPDGGDQSRRAHRADRQRAHPPRRQ